MILMNFEKRDIILIAGTLFFMIGLLPFMAPVYAVIIAILIYFGIKLYVGRRKRSIENQIGQGLCVDCGTKLSNSTCPNCDQNSE